MSLPFGPPQPVSPLIRGLRFALLIAGFLYARGKQKLYDTLEASHREEQARKKIIRDKEMAIVKARIAKEEKEAVRLFETGKLFDTGAATGPEEEARPGSEQGECPPKPPPVKKC